MTPFPDVGGLVEGGGEMGSQLRAADWGRTSLGVPSSWPAALRSAVALVLAAESPSFATWGDDHTLFYNDAFSALLDPATRGALARPAREVLQPVWAQLGPLVHQARAGGALASVVPLTLPREGYLEQREHHVSVVAIREEGGESGVLGTCLDVSAGAAAERRLAVGRELAQATRTVADRSDAFRLAARALASDPADVAFALFYLLDAEEGHATLAAAQGCRPGQAAAPLTHPLEDSPGWPIGRVARTGSAELVTSEEVGLGPLPGGPWPEPARQALVLPLRIPGEAGPTAVMVAGIGARQVLDASLHGFLEAVADLVGLAIAQSRGADLRERMQRLEEERRREEQARLRAEGENRAKDEFIRVVSHELRAPLGSILIWAQLLRGDAPDEPTLARALGIIERSTRTLAQHIDDLLDASRVLGGRLQIEKSSVDLGAAVQAAVDAQREAAKAKGLNLDLEADGAVRVRGDARRLQQVVTILLSNALKFTPQGGRVMIRLQRQGSRARLEVTDTGAGIAPDFLPQVFDRFREADGRRPRGGLGVGLAIARYLVELHGGHIAAASPGAERGSTFAVTLPLLEEATAPEREEAPAEDPRGSDRGPALDRLRILMVDDEEDAREAMEVLLRQAGAQVRTAPSVVEAMKAVEDQNFDLILSDIAMPGEDGYVLIRKARQHPRTAGLPVVALTAYATVEDRGKAIRAGFDEHVAKPVDPAALISLIVDLVRRSR